MPIDTQACVPAAFEAGATTIFTESFTDFPTSTWTAFLSLLKPGISPVRINATVSGEKFLFTLSSIVTAGLAAGFYDYAIYCESGSGSSMERGVGKRGRIGVLDNLSVAQEPTFAETMVLKLQGALELLAATTDMSVSFNGQSYTQSDIGSYRNQLVYWEAKVIRERRQLSSLRGTSESGFAQIQFAPASPHPNSASFPIF